MGGNTVATGCKAAQQVRFMMEALLRQMGLDRAVDSISIEVDSDTEVTLTIRDEGVGISTGWDIRCNSIRGLIHAEGFRVFTLRTTRGGRWHPDEEEDVTELETLNLGEAIRRMAELLATRLCDRLPDFPAHQWVEEPVLEQAW